jgi:hypothetical protein
MTASPPVGQPSLGPDDIYVYAHANGAIALLDWAGGNIFVTLAEALFAAGEVESAGGRVFAAGQNAPLAHHVLGELRAVAASIT